MALESTKTAAQRRLDRQLDELRNRLSRDVSPFDDDSAEAIAARHAACEHATEAFGRTYTPHYFESPSAAFHADIDAMLDWPSRHIFVVHGAREHAKSTRARIGLLRKILYGHWRYPLLISEELGLAKKHLDAIKTELDENRRITAEFGVEIVRFDMSEGILRIRVTPRATGKSHLVQVEAASYRTKVKGKLFLQHRPDGALIDDFEDTNSARNEKIAGRKLKWVLQELYPAVKSSAPILWLGNTSADTSALYQGMLRAYDSDEDALRSFLKRGTPPGSVVQNLPHRTSQGQTNTSRTANRKRSRRQPARAEDREPAAAISAHCYRAETPQDGGEVTYLWPERYPPSWYALMRVTMGPAIYGSEMNGDPVREGKFFKAEWFPTYDELPDDLIYWYTWFDPAFGKTETACYKSIVVVATNSTHYFVVDARLRQTDPTASMMEQWYALFEEYDALRSGGYENNFGQDDRLERDFDDAAKRKGWPLPVAGDSNSVRKEVRIESMQPLASQLRICWPKQPNADVKRLMNQMLAYPDGMVDGPDALESAISRMRGSYVGKLEYNGLAQRRYTHKENRYARR